jgi:FAD-linked oxidoreductase
MMAMAMPAEREQTSPATTTGDDARGTWSNWDRRQRCAPAVIAHPATAAELSSVLERAGHDHRTVRVAGSGHSFTALVPTDGVLLTLRRMNRVLAVDRGSGLVRVQAGIALHELNAELDRHGLALENLGDIDRQSLAGATATGTHGTGAGLRNLSSVVREVELMRADGETVSLTDDDDPDGWRAARVSLGALGVVTAMTLKTVPAFRLRGVDGPAPLDRTLERLDELAGAHDHFEFYWFPYSTTALLRRNDRTERAPTRRSATRAHLEDIVLFNHGLQAFSLLGRRWPKLIPRLNRIETRLAGSSDRVDSSYRIFCSPRLVRFTEMEYAIPRAQAACALDAVRRAIERHRFRVSFPIEVRFGAGDDALLSPAHARDTCYIAVHVFDAMEFEPYFRTVEEIMDGFGGRPHWGKRHFQTAATLAPRYPEWERFAAVRARYDPDGRFANAEITRVLGPACASASGVDLPAARGPHH